MYLKKSSSIKVFCLLVTTLVAQDVINLLESLINDFPYLKDGPMHSKPACFQALTTECLIETPQRQLLSKIPSSLRPSFRLHGKKSLATGSHSCLYPKCPGSSDHPWWTFTRDPILVPRDLVFTLFYVSQGCLPSHQIALLPATTGHQPLRAKLPRPHTQSRHFSQRGKQMGLSAQMTPKKLLGHFPNRSWTVNSG